MRFTPLLGGKVCGYAQRTPEQVEHDRPLRHDVDDEPSVTDAAAVLSRFRRPGAS